MSDTKSIPEQIVYNEQLIQNDKDLYREANRKINDLKQQIKGQKDEIKKKQLEHQIRLERQKQSAAKTRINALNNTNNRLKNTTEGRAFFEQRENKELEQELDQLERQERERQEREKQELERELDQLERQDQLERERKQELAEIEDPKDFLDVSSRPITQSMPLQVSPEISSVNPAVSPAIDTSIAAPSVRATIKPPPLSDPTQTRPFLGPPPVVQKVVVPEVASGISQSAAPKPITNKTRKARKKVPVDNIEIELKEFPPTSRESPKIVKSIQKSKLGFSESLKNPPNRDILKSKPKANPNICQNIYMNGLNVTKKYFYPSQFPNLTRIKPISVTIKKDIKDDVKKDDDKKGDKKGGKQKSRKLRKKYKKY